LYSYLRVDKRPIFGYVLLFRNKGGSVESCIIIVDDDHILRKAVVRWVRRSMKQLDIEIPLLIAESGEHALELVSEHDRGLGSAVEYMLVTDGNMPGITGPELIEELEVLLEARLLVKVIASGNPDFQGDADRLGAFFIKKPDDMAAIDQHIKLFFSIK